MKKPSKQTILTIASIVGVTTTTILSIWGGMKTKDILDNKDSGAMTKKEARKKIIFSLLPGIAAATGTTYAIIKTEKINAEAIAGLTATVGYFSRKLLAYEEGMEENLTPEKIDEIRDKFEEKELDILAKSKPKRKKYPAEETGKGDLLCVYEPLGRIFRSSEFEVDRSLRKAEARAELEPQSDNDIYDNLGIIHSEIGGMLGYPRNNLLMNRTLIFHTTIKRNDPRFGEDVLYIENDYGQHPVFFYDDPEYELEFENF